MKKTGFLKKGQSHFLPKIIYDISEPHGDLLHWNLSWASTFIFLAHEERGVLSCYHGWKCFWHYLNYFEFLKQRRPVWCLVEPWQGYLVKRVQTHQTPFYSSCHGHLRKFGKILSQSLCHQSQRVLLLDEHKFLIDWWKQKCEQKVKVLLFADPLNWGQ